MQWVGKRHVTRIPGQAVAKGSTVRSLFHTSLCALRRSSKNLQHRMAIFSFQDSRELTGMSRGSVLHWLQSLDSSFLAEETTQHGKLVPPEHRPVVREIVLRSRKVTARMHPSQRRGGRGRGHSKYTEVDQAASGSHSSHTDSPTKRPHTPDPNDAQREAVSEAATESDFHSNTRLSTVTRITSASRVSARASLTPTKSPSKSSTKRIGDLRTAKPPIKTEAATEAPQYVQALLNGFRLIQRCRGILPRILKVRVYSNQSFGLERLTNNGVRRQSWTGSIVSSMMIPSSTMAQRVTALMIWELFRGYCRFGTPRGAAKNLGSQSPRGGRRFSAQCSNWLRSWRTGAATDWSKLRMCKFPLRPCLTR